MTTYLLQSFEVQPSIEALTALVTSVTALVVAVGHLVVRVRNVRRRDTAAVENEPYGLDFGPVDGEQQP